MILNNFIRRYWWIILILLLIPLAAIAGFLIAKYCFNKALTSKELFGLIGTILGYVGTIFLGLLALWQNERANDLNGRLLKLEESQGLPYISINSNLVNVVKYKKRQPHDTYNNISCSFENPNVTFIFSVKNITENFISRIYVEEIEISGRYLDSNKILQSDVFLDEKKENLMLNSFLEPNIEKYLCISINTDKNPWFYNQLWVIMKLKLIYLNNSGANEQHLNFVALRDPEDDNLYIVTKEVMNKITIEQLFDTRSDTK
ncbi:hypothetical protein [Desulfosporosinus sp. SB140]|uniref:hypothetical protein n=1 Tax=Desulfosporosinus paludis TaxID=3115649 RepID=UPI00389094D0